MALKVHPRLSVGFFICGGSLALVLAGCGKPLQVLSDLGAEQDAIHLQVERKTSSFGKLLKDARAGRLTPGTPMDDIVARYGAPVLSREAGGANAAQTLLYRKPVDFFNSPKVYLEFDAEDLLLEARIKEPDAV